MKDACAEVGAPVLDKFERMSERGIEGCEFLGQNLFGLPVRVPYYLYLD